MQPSSKPAYGMPLPEIEHENCLETRATFSAVGSAICRTPRTSYANFTIPSHRTAFADDTLPRSRNCRSFSRNSTRGGSLDSLPDHVLMCGGVENSAALPLFGTRESKAVVRHTTIVLRGAGTLLAAIALIAPPLSAQAPAKRTPEQNKTPTMRIRVIGSSARRRKHTENSRDTGALCASAKGRGSWTNTALAARN